MDIVAQVREAVAKTLNIPAADITPDTRLDDIGLNSLEVMEVIFELEQKLGIDIALDPEILAADKAGGGTRSGGLQFDTIAQVASAIAQYIAANPGAKPAS
jgi:acyl carrier protein